MQRQVNAAGIALIKQFEGLRLEPYADQGGIATIGYGHTGGVTMETPAITEQVAEELLDEDLQNAESAVARLVHVPLTDNQFAALVSLVFNTGSMPLHKTLGRQLNDKDYELAAQSFLLWDHVNGVVSPGLEKRRQAEKELFQS